VGDVDVFAAIASPVRRALLDALRSGPLPVHQLADDFAISRPAVSQHLRLIQDAGLVRTETIGRHRWHALNPDVLLALAQWATDVVARHAKSPALMKEKP